MVKYKRVRQVSEYAKEELENYIITISFLISRCERAQQKFTQGASAHTLLDNRIKALYISKSLILNEDVTDKYTKEDLLKALPPVCSIINKCEKARIKFSEESFNYIRFDKIIRAMNISKSLIENEINKKI